MAGRAELVRKGCLPRAEVRAGMKRSPPGLGPGELGRAQGRQPEGSRLDPFSEKPLGFWYLVQNAVLEAVLDKC